MSTSPNTRTKLVWRDGKKVREHRWLMEQHIGRELRPDEHIHHIDGNPLNNDLSNLQVIDVLSHNRLHKAHEREPKACVHCGAEFVPWQRQHKRQKCCSRECAQAMRLAARDYSSSRRSRKWIGRRIVTYEEARSVTVGDILDANWERR